MTESKTLQLNAEIDFKLATELKIQLLKNGVKYKQWLENAITEYLGGKSHTNHRREPTNQTNSKRKLSDISGSAKKHKPNSEKSIEEILDTT